MEVAARVMLSACDLVSVTRDVLQVGRANLDCLEGGTHEETLRPQVNPKVKGSKFK